MSVKVQVDLKDKCQSCPFFKAFTRTEETQYTADTKPMTPTSFIVRVGCEHCLICDCIEEHLKTLYERGKLDEMYKNAGLPKQVCGHCGTTFYYDKDDPKKEATCPKCGTRYLYF